jgi:hypothetical protein
MLWPAKCGKTKPEAKTRDTIDVADPAYLRALPRKTLSTLDGRVTCILTKSEKILRHSSLQKSEIDEVASLETPRLAKGEQILEDALRQLQVCRVLSSFAQRSIRPHGVECYAQEKRARVLERVMVRASSKTFSIAVSSRTHAKFTWQGEGPVERVEQKLCSLDTDKKGKIVASTFKRIMASETTLEPVHIHYLIMAAGTWPLLRVCDSHSVPAPVYACKPIRLSKRLRMSYLSY